MYCNTLCRLHFYQQCKVVLTVSWGNRCTTIPQIPNKLNELVPKHALHALKSSMPNCLHNCNSYYCHLVWWYLLTKKSHLLTPVLPAYLQMHICVYNYIALVP